ncbi:MAG TPA: flavodoxin domain-containing protein [Candidatus Limnocylindrales bacterium]|nr:flavodoxin domain-containing protein [Candidatus Limnocylindrales bacterium]
MRILVVHASALGSTAGIAEAMGRTFGEHGLTPVIRPAERAPSPIGFDAAVIGSAVHAGHWLHSGTDYVRRHRVELAALPVWLFSVGPLGGTDPDSCADPDEISEFRRDIGPRGHRILSGAHDRSSPRIEQLPRLERFVARRFIPEGDFRDWPLIADWAASIADALAEPVPAGR